MRELGRQAILPHPRSLSGPAGSYRDAQMFMIWQERNQELWPGLRLESAASEGAERERGREFQRFFRSAKQKIRLAAARSSSE